MHPDGGPNSTSEHPNWSIQEGLESAFLTVPAGSPAEGPRNPLGGHLCDSVPQDPSEDTELLQGTSPQ